MTFFKKNLLSEQFRQKIFFMRRSLIVSLSAVGLLVFVATIYILALPDVSILAQRNPRQTAFMARYLDRQKNKKDRVFHIWIPYQKISPHLRYAVIVAEDDSFFDHNGFNYAQIREALERNIEKRRLAYGASTITQQLAKNLYLSPSKNPLRKIKEAMITRELEKHLSKKRILELYLNLIEWGPGVYGAEAAALHYYGKHASELSAEEAARLAVFLPNPQRYGRLQNSRYINRQTRTVLRRMRRKGYLKFDAAAPSLAALKFHRIPQPRYFF